MDGGSITQCTISLMGGSGVSVSGGTFPMNGGEISNNTVNSGNGSGVFAQSNSIVIINGGEIKNNSAIGKTCPGGGLYFNSSSFILNGSDIHGNTAGMKGGSFEAKDSTVTISGGKIYENTCVYGNVSLSSNTSAVMNMRTISNNITTSDTLSGCGIYKDNSKFSMYGGEISNNTASKGNGGGIYLNCSSFTMRDGKISNNSADYGGGIFTKDDISSFYIYNGEIIDNSAINGGGLFLNGTLYGPSGIFYGGTISDNTAFSKGGGFWSFGRISFYNEIMISNNYAFDYGGGIYIYNSMISTYGGRFSGNNATNGGCVFISESNGAFNLNGGEMFENIAFQYGDEVYIDNGLLLISSSDGVIRGNIHCQTQELIKVGGALTDKDVKYHLVVDGNKSEGAIVVSPYGYTVTDASQYLANLSAKDIDGNALILGKIDNNIGIVKEVYIDGANGDDNNDGSSPVLAKKSLNTSSYTINYIVNTITINSSLNISNPISLVRYSGWPVNSRYYATFNGNMIEIVSGGSLTLANTISFSGKRYTTDSNYSGHPIVLNGGTLLLNNANAINASFALNGVVYLEKGSFITQGATAYAPSSPLTI